MIGAPGRIARALRTVVRASAARDRRRVVLEIVEVASSSASGGWAGRTGSTAPSSSTTRARPTSASAVGATLHVDGEPAEVVVSKRGAGGRRVIRLDRQAPRGATLAVPRAALPEPEPDAYYVFQLVGLDVVEEGGRRLGDVVEVENTPANDVLVLDTGLLLPLVEACVLGIDLEARHDRDSAAVSRTTSNLTRACASTSSLRFPTRSRG